jgi:hypothetical protein
MRNNHPLIAAAGAPVFEEAHAEGGIGTDLSYFSVFSEGENDQWRTVVDMEAAVFDIRAARAWGPSAELGVDLPILYYYEGFLDGALSSLHGTLGTGNGSRKDRPEDQYLYIVQRDGKTVIRGDRNRVAWGDVRTWGKWLFHRGHDLTVSLYGFLDVPTGNSYKGYGNGSVDLGTALLANFRYDEHIDLFANAGRVFPGDYKGHERIRLYDFLYAALGMAWRYSKETIVMTEIMWGQSPYRMGIRDVDNDWVLWSLGVKRDAGKRGSMHLMFTEDASTKAAPDFMLTVGYEYSLQTGERGD